jgi:hypothetical protein
MELTRLSPRHVAGEHSGKQPDADQAVVIRIVAAGAGYLSFRGEKMLAAKIVLAPTSVPFISVPEKVASVADVKVLAVDRAQKAAARRAVGEYRIHKASLRGTVFPRIGCSPICFSAFTPRMPSSASSA